jgi:hypothetical protein
MKRTRYLQLPSDHHSLGQKVTSTFLKQLLACSELSPKLESGHIGSNNQGLHSSLAASVGRRMCLVNFGHWDDITTTFHVVDNQADVFGSNHLGLLVELPSDDVDKVQDNADIRRNEFVHLEFAAEESFKALGELASFPSS